LRLHGRNHATWNIQGTTASSDRFNYGYDDDKLAGLATQIYEIWFCRGKENHEKSGRNE